MKRFDRLLLGSLLGIALSVSPIKAWCDDAQSFQIRMDGGDGATLGDLHPAYIDMEAQRLPSIPLKEVARRYEQLFKTAKDPDVRIDALHRLLNLQAIAGDSIDITPDQERVLYRKALASYEMIVNSGIYYGRLDELLYQMARAYDFIGEDDKSVERLKQLVGLFPKSEFVVEARFRIAEYDFSHAHYADAEAAYAQVMQDGQGTPFAEKSQYMLGWSQYKAGQSEAASHTFIQVLDRYYARSDGFHKLDRIDQDTVNDTFRILSISAAYSGGAKALDRLLDQVGDKPYAYMLYDRLADYYLANDRYSDSVATGQAFLDRYPDHPKAPAIAAQMVTAYEDGGFVEEARTAKQQFITRFATKDKLGRLDAEERKKLYGYLKDLGRWHYAQAQSDTQADQQRQDYAQAGHFLAQLGQLYPADPDVGPNLLLAGDAYAQAGTSDKALSMYRQAAYSSPDFDRAPDAAYAAVLIRRQDWKQQASPASLDALVAESRQFVTVFQGDARADAVRVHIANVLYDNKRNNDAVTFANPVTVDTAATPEERRAAWLVVGNVAFDESQYADAERAYRQALQLAANDATLKGQITEKLATDIYRQGQQAEAAGRIDEAVAHYQRVGSVAPQSPVRIVARFDAANALLKAKRWQSAINELVRFQHDFPASPLQAKIPAKLVYAYDASGQSAHAADELMSWSQSDKSLDKAALWKRKLRAAALYEKAGDQSQAFALYSAYLTEQPSARDAGDYAYRQELRGKLAARADQAGDTKARDRWNREMVAHERKTSYGNDRTHYLASNAAITLADEDAAAFRAVKLTLPLKRSLERKRVLLKKAIDAYETAQSFGIAETVTRSTYALGELYYQLSLDVLHSERPKSLDKKQLAQYDVLLEDQAYPFEEKAITLYEQNQQRIPQGVYNVWVQKSLDALATLYPARYAREEKWLGWVDAKP